MISAHYASSAAAGLFLPAHGLGGRTDLPVEPGLAAAGAATAVALSFVMLADVWPRPRFTDRNAGRPLPRSLARVLGAPVVARVLRGIVLLLSGLVIAVAFLGPGRSDSNLAPYALYVVFWVGLVPASLIFGPVWRLLNPLRLLHSGLCRITGINAEKGVRQLPVRAGLWPAAGGLLAFVWLELVFPYRAVPILVGLFLVLYAAVTLSLALLFGRKWFSAGDGFETYSTIIGSMAPIGRRDDGALVLRNPMTGLSSLSGTPGLAAVAAVLIGSTGFDGLTRTQHWMNNVRPDSILLGTAALLGLVVVVGALFTAAIYASNRLPRRLPGKVMRKEAALNSPEFAHSLIPVALGYGVAHYFSFLLFEGQVALALISDPFGLGWNLFGTSERWVNYLLVGPNTIGWTQVSAIVIGHIVGLLAAHDHALALFDSRRQAIRSQIPIAMLMIGITSAGVLLLVSV